jgi:hypothetical protein
MENDFYYYIILIVFLSLLYLGLLAFYIICYWKIFIKAGKPGWAAIVPVYNIIVALEIVSLPWWFIFLMIFVPLANLVIVIILLFQLAKAFGRSVAFGFGLLFLGFVFIPILAFGSATYTKPESSA